MILSKTAVLAGLLLMLAPAPLVAPLAAASIAFTLLGRPSASLDRRSAPAAVWIGIASLRALAAPAMWWETMLAWLVGLAMAAHNVEWRRFCPALSLAAAALCGLGCVPSAAPAALLGALAVLDWSRLGSRQRAVLTLTAAILVGLAGSDLSQASGPEGLLRQLDRWWRTQFAALEVVRIHPIWGAGPGALVLRVAPELPGPPDGAGAVPVPLLALIAEHGWLGYACLGLAVCMSARRVGDPAWWLVGALLVLAPQSWASDLIRLAPALGLLAGSALAAKAVEVGLSPRPHAEDPLFRGLRWAVAGCILVSGLLQGAAAVMIALADARALALDWPQADRFYRWAARIAPRPHQALQRASDLALRWSRYRGDRWLGAAALPLKQALEMGIDEAWTLYRLAEISGFERAPDSRIIALLRAAAESAPRSALIRVALGHRLLAAGRPEQAVAEFRTAVSLRRAVFGHLFWALRRITTNSSLLRQILPPGDLESHVELARLFEQSGLVPAAIREFEVLLAEEDAPAWVHREFAALLGRSGRIRLALDRLQELLRWPSLGPRQKLETLILLGRLEPDPDLRLGHLVAALDLLGPDELGGASLLRLLEPLDGDRAAQTALLARADRRLRGLASMRPELVAQARAELAALARQRGLASKP
jgi:tetratricopeptide (TPR) repeat protein